MIFPSFYILVARKGVQVRRAEGPLENRPHVWEFGASDYFCYEYTLLPVEYCSFKEVKQNTI